MATKPEFPGPIRPRLALDHITIDPQVIQMLRADGPAKVELTLSQQLAAGWEHYFLWETLIAVGFAVDPAGRGRRGAQAAGDLEAARGRASRSSSRSTWAASR